MLESGQMCKVILAHIHFLGLNSPCVAQLASAVRALSVLSSFRGKWGSCRVEGEKGVSFLSHKYKNVKNDTDVNTHRYGITPTPTPTIVLNETH